MNQDQLTQKTRYQKGFLGIIVLIVLALVLLSLPLGAATIGSFAGTYSREGTPAERGIVSDNDEYFADLPPSECGTAISQKAQERVGERAIDFFPTAPTRACAYFVSQIVNPIARPSPPLGASAQEQWNSRAGRQISRSEISPGDVVYFAGTYDNGRTISHTGIYIGGSRFIDSGGRAGPGGTQTVRISNLSGYWNNHYYGTKRYCMGEEI